MSKIIAPQISENETTELSGENQANSIEIKYRGRLTFFKIFAHWALLALGSVLIVVFIYRYVLLLDSYKEVTTLYLVEKDWEIVVIYALSLAFTSALLVSVLAVMHGLVRKKNNGSDKHND